MGKGRQYARMAELQAAQQDVLANFAKEFGPNGSSTPLLLSIRCCRCNQSILPSLTSPSRKIRSFR